MIGNLIKVSAGVLMGFGLGANDAANLFGTGVAAKVITFRNAVILIAIFVIIGAVLEGPKCMDTVKGIANIPNQWLAFTAAFSAALTIALMTYLGMPVSTSQAIMGSIIGSAYVYSTPRLTGLTKIFSCWVFTPIGAGLIAFVLYIILDKFVDKYIRTDRGLHLFIKYSLILSGCYGAYSLGANNSANTTGVYYSCGLLTKNSAAIIAGISIAIGAVTFSRKVMMTVGHKITTIGPLGSLVATLANAITIHIFTQIKVPVSTSQAIVGAVIGIGMVRGIKAISKDMIIKIFFCWVGTPLIAGIVGFLFTQVYYNFLRLL